MKLLLDQNISKKLVRKLQEYFPNSIHIASIKLNKANDIEIWNYAKANNFTIVSQDADFFEILIMRGHPPHVVWLKMGNTSSLNILNKLISNRKKIVELQENNFSGCIEIESEYAPCYDGKSNFRNSKKKNHWAERQNFSDRNFRIEFEVYVKNMSSIKDVKHYYRVNNLENQLA